MVRNTPDNIAIIEAILDSSLRNVPLWVVAITAHIVAGPAEKLRKASREALGLPDHRAVFDDLLKSGDIRVAATGRIETRSGLPCALRIGQNTPFPSYLSGSSYIPSPKPADSESPPARSSSHPANS